MTQVSENDKKYFEKQGKFSNLCGMHVINNFLGSGKYTEKKLNEACLDLSPDCINPHKSIFGGNYDVNVLISIFLAEGYDLKYHNNRNPLELNNEQCGFILNYELDACPLFKLFGFGRHWSLIKRQKGGFVEYDSLLENPAPLTQVELLNRLKGLSTSGSTILIINHIHQTEVLVHVKGTSL